jgi:archaemetzincin
MADGRIKQLEENLYPEIESKLRPLALPLGQPGPGDWLYEHRERGQTFRQYLAAGPVRRGNGLGAIYLCRLGDFTGPQEQILERAREYLGIWFNVPVHDRCRVRLSAVPARARRRHPESGDEQLLTTFILRELLGPDRPADALAYLAFTAADLWPGRGWSFFFGEADLRERVAVCSLCRNGDPGKNAKEYRRCLRRTLRVATHETGHVLTMAHCTAFRCLMNGFNGQHEQDHAPMYLCPVCLRKLLWNLQVEHVPYLKRLEDFCRRHGLREEAAWYAEAVAELEK